MPELPEAEHARARIERFLRGRTLTDARALDGLVVRTPAGAPCPPSTFAGALVGDVVTHAERRGKRVLVVLRSGRALGVTLGMTGKPVLLEEAPLPPHTRWSVSAGPRTLALVDPRRLSRAAVGARPEVEQFLGYGELGPEPDTFASPAALAARFAGVRAPIQGALMDQHRIAGLGNIHAAEALFLAGIRPTRATSSLLGPEWAALRRGIRAALKRAALDPDEPLTYATEGGEASFLVYGRDGEPCARCRTPIHKARGGGRSWFYCPRCQPARAAR